MLKTNQELPQQKSELRVSTLEVFFDIVFVFTLMQLTGILAYNLTFETFVQALLIFIVLFWMYGGYAWLTNSIPPNLTIRRVLILAGMLAFLVTALAIPVAFEGGGNILFGIGYLLVILVHAAAYLRKYGKATLRFVPLNILPALLIVAAGFFDGGIVYALWCAAIVALAVNSYFGPKVEFNLHPLHFVERHGLLLIVALGELIIAIGTGAHVLNMSLFSASILGLVLISSLWWMYFTGDSDSAEKRMIESKPMERNVLAIKAYFYAYLPLLFGLVLLATTVKAVADHSGDPLSVGYALALGGGVALYILGTSMFRHAMRIQPLRYRVAAILASLATVFVGLYASAILQIVCLVGVTVVMIIAEARNQQRLSSKK